MAITITEIAGQPNSGDQMGFMIDTEADIADLPTLTERGKTIRGTCSAGSYATTSDGRIFVLGNDNKWHEW